MGLKLRYLDRGIRSPPAAFRLDCVFRREYAWVAFLWGCSCPVFTHFVTHLYL